MITKAEIAAAVAAIQNGESREVSIKLNGHTFSGYQNRDLVSISCTECGCRLTHLPVKPATMVKKIAAHVA